MKNNIVHIEERTARITFLIDPRKKKVFERLCSQEDLTSSQVIRRLIRGYIVERLGRPWSPDEEGPAKPGAPIRRTSKRGRRRP